MANFEIGLSALRASQFALNVVSNNIANANTEGYHRRLVQNVALQPTEQAGFRIGTGVTVDYVKRIRSEVIETSLTNADADLSQIDQLLSIELQIQETLVRGSGSTVEEIDNLFANLTELTAVPGEASQRAGVIETARRLASSLQDASTQLSDLRSTIDIQLDSEIELLNDQMKKLGELNVEIRMLESSGQNANAELDERDQLFSEIAEAIGASRVITPKGDFNFLIGNASFQQAAFQTQFSISKDEDGRIQVFLDEGGAPIELESGRIAGLQEGFNTAIPKYQEKLDTLASELIQLFNSTHAIGVGPAGAFDQLTGNRPVEDPDVPLANTSTDFPISDGELTVSIIDPQGVRRNETISIDVETDSLQDVADRLDAIPGLNASVSRPDNRLRLFGDVDTTFDFTGAIENAPDTTGLTGTGVPTLSGSYVGTINQDVTFQIVGTGDVGVTEDLAVNLLDGNGNLIETVQIGRGYEAGTAIKFENGVELTFAAGTVVDGETFTSEVIARPDTAGILSALGLNSFFTGTSAGDIQIASEIQEDPNRLATGITSDISDTANLIRLADLQDSLSLPGGQTLAQYANEINTEIGFEISADIAISTSLVSMQVRLENERDAISGVDLNEELVYLQQYQRSYEAAARVIQAADEMLNTLFNILR